MEIFLRSLLLCMPCPNFLAFMNSLCSSVSPAVVPCPPAPLKAAVPGDCPCPGLPLRASCWTSKPFSDSDVWERPVQVICNGSYLKIKSKTKCSDFPLSFVTLSKCAHWFLQSSYLVVPSCSIELLTSHCSPAASVAESSLHWNGKCLGRFWCCCALGSLCCF